MASRCCRNRAWYVRRAIVVSFCGLTLSFCASHRLFCTTRLGKKLDASSAVRLQRLEAKGTLSPESTVSVLVAFKSRERRLPRQIGFVPGFCWDRFCTGDIHVSNLGELLSARTVQIVRLSGNAAPAPEYGNHPTVLVGIIDRGLFWRDQGLWDYGGRLLYLWDQTDPHGPGPAIMRSSYGTELTGFELASSTNPRAVPVDGFGHGLGIVHLAAANGSPPRNGADRLVMALKLRAPVILVNTLGTESGVLDAVRYIVQRSHELGMKCVINFSYSEMSGPPDSTNLLVSAINAGSVLRDFLLCRSVMMRQIITSLEDH